MIRIRSKFREFLFFLSLLFVHLIQIFYLFNPYSLVQRVPFAYTHIYSVMSYRSTWFHALTEKCPMHMQFGIVPDAFRHKRAKH